MPAQKLMTYNHAVACQCGLDAAVVLQRLIDLQPRYEGGWIPRSVAHVLDDQPYISRTSVKKLIMLLRAAGLIETTNRGQGRTGERLHYRVRQPVNLVAEAGAAAVPVPAAVVAELLASAEEVSA